MSTHGITWNMRVSIPPERSASGIEPGLEARPCGLLFGVAAGAGDRLLEQGKEEVLQVRAVDLYPGSLEAGQELAGVQLDAALDPVHAFVRKRLLDAFLEQLGVPRHRLVHVQLHRLVADLELAHALERAPGAV